MVGTFFGTDGIRGKVGKDPITPEFMLRLGWALGSVFLKEHSNRVLIGKDTRVSGYMFESALQAGLVSSGMNVALLGPMPTPAIAYLTRALSASRTFCTITCFAACAAILPNSADSTAIS